MPDAPEDQAAERERLARQAIAAMLQRARTAHERRLLQKALEDPANRERFMEEYFHGGRHHATPDDEDEPR